MEDSKFTYIKVNIYLPALLTIPSIGRNISLQMGFFLTLGAVLVPEPLFLPRSFHLLSAEMFLKPPDASRCSDGLHWELLHGVTGCGSFDFIPFNNFLLYLPYQNFSNLTAGEEQLISSPLLKHHIHKSLRLSCCFDCTSVI